MPLSPLTLRYSGDFSEASGVDTERRSVAAGEEDDDDEGEEEEVIIIILP